MSAWGCLRLLRSVTYDKGKACPRTDHEGRDGECRYKSTLSLTSVLERGGWLTPRPSCFTPGNEIRYQFIGDWRPQGRSGRVRKISPSPWFEPLTAQPVDSRYTDWAIPAHVTLVGKLNYYKECSVFNAFKLLIFCMIHVRGQLVTLSYPHWLWHLAFCFVSSAAQKHKHHRFVILSVLILLSLFHVLLLSTSRVLKFVVFQVPFFSLSEG